MSVLGAFWPGFGWFIWPVGCAMRECSEEVRFGMTRFSSSWEAGREALDRGLEVKEGGISSDGSLCRELEEADGQSFASFYGRLSGSRLAAGTWWSVDSRGGFAPPGLTFAGREELASRASK